MSGVMTAGVNNNNIHQENWHIPFLLASAIVAADVGKAVALDTAAANTVKLAGDNDQVLGRLETFEDRTTEGIKVGTVAIQGILVLPCVTSTPALGARVTGSSTGGLVKTAGTPADATAAAGQRQNIVIARDDTAKTVTVVLGI